MPLKRLTHPKKGVFAVAKGRAMRGAMQDAASAGISDDASAGADKRLQANGEAAAVEEAEKQWAAEGHEILRERYTKYEKARIIGARALQIAMGAPILINTDKTDPIEIAIEEFERGVIPITVRRRR